MPESSIRFTVVEWHGGELVDALNDMMQDRMREANSAVQKEIERSLSTPFPPASRPGQPPHTRTGELRRSIRTRATKSQQGATGTIGSVAPYALDLEFGTSRIAPRPFMRPALERSRREILRILGKPGFTSAFGRLRSIGGVR